MGFLKSFLMSKSWKHSYCKNDWTYPETKSGDKNFKSSIKGYIEMHYRNEKISYKIRDTLPIPVYTRSPNLFLRKSFTRKKWRGSRQKQNRFFWTFSKTLLKEMFHGRNALGEMLQFSCYNRRSLIKFSIYYE